MQAAGADAAGDLRATHCPVLRGAERSNALGLPDHYGSASLRIVPGASRPSVVLKRRDVRRKQALDIDGDRAANHRQTDPVVVRLRIFVVVEVQDAEGLWRDVSDFAEYRQDAILAMVSIAAKNDVPLAILNPQLKQFACSGIWRSVSRTLIHPWYSNMFQQLWLRCLSAASLQLVALSVFAISGGVSGGVGS